jgi:hypothetical protein
MFRPTIGHHQVNTGTYMCILNCKCLPNIWAHFYNLLLVAIYIRLINIRNNSKTGKNW